ncbi:MAG: WYL domain-containing protein [Nitriliruptorales bacterium]|nr:WYL domain-containing protein [Nitriliruptorales bacterium]
MSAVDAAARMLTLVPWLLSRPGASVGEAAAALGATEAEITADLKRLDFCGLPGLGGGDLMEVHWFNDRVILLLAHELRRPLRPTVAEAVRLLLAAETVLAASPEPIPELVSALEKLRRAAGVPADAVVSVTDDEPWLEHLRTVLAGSTCIQIQYQGREDDRPRSRPVDPWQLELLNGFWYLHGRDLDIDEARVFRLDRISAVDAIDVPRGPVPDELPSPAYVPEDEQRVVIEVGPAARWLAGSFDGVVEAVEGEQHVLTFGTDALGHVAAHVVRAAGAAVVREPVELRHLVHEHAERALTAYGPRDTA